MLITFPHVEPLDNEIPANDPKAQAVVDRLQLPRRSTPAHDREKADRVTLCVVCHERRGPLALLLLAEPVAHFVAPSAEPDGFIFVGKANTDASAVALQRLPKKVEEIAAGHGHLLLALPKRWRRSPRVTVTCCLRSQKAGHQGKVNIGHTRPGVNSALHRECLAIQN
jgi:hypothetical protein